MASQPRERLMVLLSATTCRYYVALSRAEIICTKPTRTRRTRTYLTFRLHQRNVKRRLMRSLDTILLLLLRLVGVNGKVAPNQLLGTCLTEDWVKTMEASLKVNAQERDSKGRLKNPFLRAASQFPRYKLEDARTQDPNAYSAECMPAKTTFYGVEAKFDDITGDLLSSGFANGSVILELNEWTTHSLSTMTLAILAAEVYGYPVSLYSTEATLSTTERMSSAPAGLCTPTHVNLEVWPGKEALLQVYANESSVVGPTGYVAQSGLYTTIDFVKDSYDYVKYSELLNADFWRSYTVLDKLIDSVSYADFASSPYFPTGTAVCSDNTMGCQNYCSKSNACKLREIDGKNCIVVIMMSPNWDPGYLQASMSNLGIPAYFCFLGFGGTQNYALAMQQANKPVLFYHYEPELFHFNNPGLFQRVMLPRPIPERVQLNKGTFGENGYGEPTNNPVDVDFPNAKLAKYAASVIQQSQPIGSLVSRFALQDIDMNYLMREYITASKDAAIPDAFFHSACGWVKHNYQIWSAWLDRAPLCTLDDHVEFNVSGCMQNSTRVISFAWAQPDAMDPTKPANCDGGLEQLPKSIQTSRSCDWIETDPSKWKPWIGKRPGCDTSFYNFEISECDASVKRTVHYQWLLPNQTDPSKSLECQGGVRLPVDVVIDCEYMPTSSGTFKALAVIHNSLIAILLVALGFVFYNRDKPIVKRSQHELLMLMIVGGILVCVAALLYAGRPSRFLCAARPFFISTGFTVIFGSLFVKSLRVYRVFMKSALKRVTVTVGMMFKLFSILLGVDVLILAVWFIVDFPEPTISIDQDRQLGGEVDRITCKSTTFLFTAVLMFWKAVLLFLGIYLSFLVRNVSADFQESIWIFASSVVVLIACLVILPLAYMVQLPASAFYIFLASVLFLSTASVMGMMLIPKMVRLQEVAKSSKYSTQDSGASKVVRSVRIGSILPGAKNDSSSTTTTNTTGKALITPVRESTRSDKLSSVETKVVDTIPLQQNANERIEENNDI